jgi:hypothetical protein
MALAGYAKQSKRAGSVAIFGEDSHGYSEYAKDPKWEMQLVEDRETSLLGALKMHEKWDRKANDRIRVWFGSRTPGG